MYGFPDDVRYLNICVTVRGDKDWRSGENKGLRESNQITLTIGSHEGGLAQATSAAEMLYRSVQVEFTKALRALADEERLAAEEALRQLA